MSFEYLQSLNPEQTEAVIHSGSPLLILAGAGSGKTRVITTKIAYLIQHQNIEPWQILAVTFTKKAAKEMQDRAVLLEPKASDAQIKTFHSFGAWFLRRYAEVAGLDPNFTVYDDEDSATLIQKAMPALTKKQATQKAHEIALCKDYCLGPEDDLSMIDKDGDLNEVYRAYQNRLHGTGNADFGDLIMLPVKIMERDERIRSQMHYRFKVIMVDEYQDSNVAQFKLLKALSDVKEDGSGTYVCVVGDDDQSIYKFRGAEVQNILQFPNYFKNTQVIRLERNYRSTNRILQCADAVVKNNQDRLGKTLVAERGDGKEPVLVFLENQDREAEFCSQIIKQAVAAGANYSDFAILYRTNAQSLTFETEFLNKRIPYAIVGSLKFYEREEIKDALSYLSLFANNRDEIAFTRIVNKPVRGIGAKTQEKIIEKAHADDGMLEADFNLLGALENSFSILNKKAQEGAKEFLSLYSNLKNFLEENSVKEEIVDAEIKELAETAADATKTESKDFRRLSEFIQKLTEDSGLVELHKAQDDMDGTQRVLNLQELVNSAIRYPLSMKGLLDFLDEIELNRTLANETEDTPDAVTLITVHNTKGLEFNRVIITGLENGIFPREDKWGEDLEEERRLFYVGVTRAKDELYITSCAFRRLYGHTQIMMPSRFLVEAGDTLKAIGSIPRSFKRSFETGFEEEADEGPKAELLNKWKIGVNVYHDDYGMGQIVSSQLEGNEVVILVQFESGGKKKFLPEYQGNRLDIIKD